MERKVKLIYLTFNWSRDTKKMAELHIQVHAKHFYTPVMTLCTSFTYKMKMIYTWETFIAMCFFLFQ